MNLDENKKRNSFYYAFSGIFQAFKSEKNIRADFIITVIVIILGIVLKISIIEWIICVILIGIVVSLELINTSIETTVDLCTREKHPLAKRAKDIAAGAVLVGALSAAIAGAIIFIPKIIVLIK